MKSYVTEKEKDPEQIDQSETPYEQVGRFWILVSIALLCDPRRQILLRSAGFGE